MADRESGPPESYGQEQRRLAATHAAHLIREFEGAEILTALGAISMFLYHTWRTNLEHRGLTFEEFAHDVGVTLGYQHQRRLQAEHMATKN